MWGGSLVSIGCPISLGIVEVNEFLPKPKLINCVKSPISLGIVEVKALLSKDNSVNCVKSPISLGIVDVNELSPKFKNVNRVNSPISLGIVEVNSLLDKSKNVKCKASNCVESPISLGIVEPVVLSLALLKGPNTTGSTLCHVWNGQKVAGNLLRRRTARCRWLSKEKYNRHYHRSDKAARKQGKTHNNPATLVPFRSKVFGLGNYYHSILLAIWYPLGFHSIQSTSSNCGVGHSIYLFGIVIRNLFWGSTGTSWTRL
ncbi:hypothetical protein MHU86_9412 [Fragilaria crotonensis]|nr:hypothetical protein MHU86_9412 [Fragilaria crotonensis]